MHRATLRLRKKLPSKLEAAEEPGRHNNYGWERLIFFSDAVFAIAITLLALEIRLPAAGNIYNDRALRSQLIGMWQRYLAYIISFLVIGTFWISHHRKFRFIIRYDSRLLLLNLLFLMIIAFIPFPSSVLSENPGRTATIFYALTMVLASLALTAVWWYASWHNRLIVPNLEPIQRRRQFLSPIITAGVFLISIGVAFIDPGLARLSWLLILFTSMIAARGD